MVPELNCPGSDLVCGCDGHTYDNDCWRVTAGVPREGLGPCQQDAGTCVDSDLEPNDTPQAATNIGSPESRPQGIALYSLAICSPTDVDYYLFTLSASRSVKLVVAVTGDLAAMILDSSGAVVLSATPIGSTGLMGQATMGPGAFYLKVTAGASGSPNSYDAFSLTLQ